MSMKWPPDEMLKNDPILQRYIAQVTNPDLVDIEIKFTCYCEKNLIKKDSSTYIIPVHKDRVEESTKKHIEKLTPLQPPCPHCGGKLIHEIKTPQQDSYH